MEKVEQFQADRQTLESAQSAYLKSAQDTEKINLEHRSLLSRYMDGILLYSAGAFSFTVALIGLVDSSRIGALARIGFLVPNIYWLYTCWLFFLGACISVLLSRRFDAYYTMYYGLQRYTAAYKYLEEVRLTFTQKYPENILFVSPQEEQDKKTQHNINVLEDANNKNKKGSDLWYKVMRISDWSAEICVAIGVVTLMIFSTQLSQSLIWK